MTAESEQIASIEGSVLNYRYQIDRILNDKGGMGLIYQATDLNLRGTVVLKKSRFVDDQSRSAFEREARLLYGLRHNALPRVIDYFLTEDQSQFFVMEFIPGKDLSELLSMRIERGEGPFPMDQVLDWYEQLLDALYYLHSHEPPIIHRDIKPQNLKLMPNGQIILLDFGLAKGSVGGMTMGVSIQGYTPNYAPLEQMRGSGTDARSDIYSLAVTMHCLLTGQMPPDAVSRAIETLSAQPDPLRAVHDINANIPLVISDLIGRACSLNQNDRPQTAAIMRDMLKRARTQATGKLGNTGKQAPLPANERPVKPHKTENEEAKAQQAAQPAEGKPALEMPVSSVGQETQIGDTSPSRTPQVNVVKADENQANPPAKEPAKNIEAAENQFIHAFAPVKTNPPVDAEPQVAPANETPAPKAEEAAAPTPAVQTPAPAVIEAVIEVKANGHQNNVPAPKIENEPVISLESNKPKTVELKPDERILINSDKPLNPFASPEAVKTPSPKPPPQPLPKFAPPVAASVESERAREPKHEFHPNNIVVIEHVDEGKALEHRHSGANGGQVAQQPAVPASINQQRVSLPPSVNGNHKAEMRNGGAHPSGADDLLIRARQVAESLDKPRDIINNLKKEKPKEEEPKFPSVDPDLGANLAASINSSGLRSFTEVIGFGVRLEMHAIPGGEFMMGSVEKRGYNDEFPQHKVAISPFYIGRYPVTQKQFRAVMRTNPSAHLEDSHPVENVTWDEAVEFCRRLTIATGRIYRLPTEAEWEYACRAGTTSLFTYGDDEDTLNQYGWNLTNSGNHTHPVGEKKPNGWGLCDMHGNVWEWCLDWYDQMYYLQSPKVNPNGPTKGTSRVLRGGSRYSLPNYCRSATRSNHQPDQRDALVGFRVVCEARGIARLSHQDQCIRSTWFNDQIEQNCALLLLFPQPSA